MIEINAILCPVDFSDYSRRALAHAAAIARWYDSTITALHVIPPTPVMPYAPGLSAFEATVLTPVDRERVARELREFVDACCEAPRVDILLADGNAAREIVRVAGELPADLIVMGTHGHGGFERLLLGSVTEKVLRKARCPVLTVPRQGPATPSGASIVVKEMLCPIDFSDSSLRALDYATSLAKEADAQLTVLHVAPPAESNLLLPDAVGDPDLSLEAYRRRRDENLQQRLTLTVAGQASEYCSMEPLLVHGTPWKEILRVAAERGAGLIVMGVQGRGATDIMLFGSTTQHVVRQATCPVLTIRAGA